MTKILTQKSTTPVRKTDISGTVNNLGIGESVIFKMRQAKSTTVRVAVYRIQKRTSKQFTTTERDMVGEIMVIRTK